MTHTTITPELPISEAGRLLMIDELETIQGFWEACRESADITAVHETRKAIRRTFTLFKLFAPYFAPEDLRRSRSGLRRIMRRLAPCRDIAVFRSKLAACNEAAERPLNKLAIYWARRQEKADDRLRHFFARKSATRIISRYAALLAAPGDSAALALVGQQQVAHALPGLVFERIGRVRAWGEIRLTATPRQFHQLRIQFKELRYTLTFFEEVLRPDAAEFIDLSRRIQDHLGDLNDASVAVDLLRDMKKHRGEAGIYRAHQQTELARLTTEFQPLYAEFDQPAMRRSLAVALANL
ncbi:MAG: CHAD domain-containing protein [Anaerolineales bacterium]|nr:CHAD domain-containing protein [Anaerolineales bacterium]MCB8934095.1 CHAD domain-containing protein [Promineifilum sp.]